MKTVATAVVLIVMFVLMSAGWYAILTWAWQRFVRRKCHTFCTCREARGIERWLTYEWAGPAAIKPVLVRFCKHELRRYAQAARN